MSKTDFDEVTGRARASAQNAADHINEAAGSAVRGARQLKEDAGRYAKDQLYRAKSQAADAGVALYERAGSSLEQQSSQLDTYVRSNPLKSIGVAFGVGVLFGLVTRR